jgi:hypothetical protein
MPVGLAEEPAAPTVEPLFPPPADEPPVPTVDADPLEPEPAAEPPVPTLELLLPPPAEVPPVPRVDAEPEPAAEPPVPTLELLVPPPAEVPPVPSVDAEPLPEPADEPPVPTLELLVPPPAEVPPVPTVELDCATASAVPASNAAAAAEIFRSFMDVSFYVFQSAKTYAWNKESDEEMFLEANCVSVFRGLTTIVVEHSGWNLMSPSMNAHPTAA